MLRETREAAGMTLENAAGKLRISPGYLYQIEKGTRGVGKDRADQIAELYAKKRDELFEPIRFAARHCGKGGKS